MDRIVDIIVRLACLVARSGARVVPNYASFPPAPGKRIRVLLAGYNGARNTGSDVRVAALAEQLRDAFGPDAIELSVMTLDEESTAVYFDRIAQQIPFRTLFFAKLFEACSQHHVVVLCEGSTLKSKFANALTLYNCQAAGIAKAQGKPCVAYGSEIGAMDPFLERSARVLCSDAHFIARSTSSLAELDRLGLQGHLGTDTAWTFDSARAQDVARELLRAQGWDGKTPLLGVAPVNPYCWPVKPSLAKLAGAVLCGKRELQFQSWYFFSWSRNREAKLYAYIEALAQAIATCCSERGLQPVIVGMEQLDRFACLLLQERLAALDAHGTLAPIVLSNNHDGYTIAEVLRSLHALVTSRYHAQVLATGNSVPAVAVSMDERLGNLAQELNVPDDLLLHVDEADLAPKLLAALDYALDNRSDIAESLDRARDGAIATTTDMAAWFQGYVSSPNRE